MIRRSNYVQARALLHAREKSAAAGDTTGSVRQAAKKTAGKVGRRFGAALTGAFVAADAVRPISESATKSLKSISKTPRLQSQAIKYASAGGLSSEQITSLRHVFRVIGDKHVKGATTPRIETFLRSISSDKRILEPTLLEVFNWYPNLAEEVHTAATGSSVAIAEDIRNKLKKELTQGTGVFEEAFAQPAREILGKMHRLPIKRPFGERVRRMVGGLSAKGGDGRIALLAAAIPAAMYISEKIQDRATIPSKKKLNTILERDSNGIIAAEHERDPMKVWDFYKVLHKANPEMMGEPTTALPILESTLRTGAVTYSDIDTLLRARETAAKIVKTKFETVSKPLMTLL